MEERRRGKRERRTLKRRRTKAVDYSYTFSAVFSRVQEKTNIGTQTELADAVGVRQSAVSDSKKRGSFPLAWAVIISRTHGISLDYLIIGKEDSKPLANSGSQENGAPEVIESIGDYIADI